jgi:membrane carboxypeptidase/penicillin-binding protein
MLAGLVKAPSAYDPASSDQSAAMDRRNYVLDRMTDVNTCRRSSPHRSKRSRSCCT